MPEASLAEQKPEFRRIARKRRKTQPNRAELSERIIGAVMSLPEFACAATVMFYVDTGSEVQTQFALPQMLSLGKTVVVPWCNDDGELELFRLRDPRNLIPGRYNIPEPKPELRLRPEHQIDLAELAFIVVPGVGFDYSGNRLGQGKGYYDKLLARISPDAALVAPAFECQMFDNIPTQTTDVRMHIIVTEEGVYDARMT